MNAPLVTLLWKGDCYRIHELLYTHQSKAVVNRSETAACTIFLLLQNGLVGGVMQILLLSVSAKVTEQLGMAPGGEFRRAFHEVSDTEELSDTQVVNIVTEVSDTDG